MVAARLEPGRSSARRNHRGADDFFGARLRVATSRVDCAERVRDLQPRTAVSTQIRSEEALRDFDFVAGAKLNVLRGIFPESAHVENSRFAASQEANVPLVGKIVKSAGG